MIPLKLKNEWRAAPPPAAAEGEAAEEAAPETEHERAVAALKGQLAAAAADEVDTTEIPLLMVNRAPGACGVRAWWGRGPTRGRCRLRRHGRRCGAVGAAAVARFGWGVAEVRAGTAATWPCGPR